MDPLFPVLPEDLTALSDEELSGLLDEFKVAFEAIEREDPEYVGDMSAADIITALEQGVDQIKQIKDEQSGREEAEGEYVSKKTELLSAVREQIEPKADEAEELAVESAEADDEAEGEGEGEEVAAEADAEAEAAEEQVAVVAAAEPPAVEPQRQPAYYRRPAIVVQERVAEKPNRTVLVAAAGVPGVPADAELDRIGLANAMIDYVKRTPRPQKHANGVEEKQMIAAANFAFPPERILRQNDADGNNAKIAAIGNPYLGVEAQKALVASGGLCAPLTPLYDIPDFAVTSRPVRDSLPSFQAERGGVSVPSVSTIGDITTAITVIEEEEDALGGTFATKSCQDLTCPTWTDVAVGIIAHCREYGNLNARAWPEGIAHENNLTMAAHARTAEQRLLDRIKALSINVTSPQVLGATIDLVYAITRAAAGIRFRLRLDETAPNLRALMPAWVPDLLMTDVVSTQFDRFKTRQELVNVLRLAGIEPTFYLDDIGSGTSQGFADETASAIDDFPDDVQWALFLEGTFLHLDGGVLELGVVRDSTLNSTNDYQVFGETFENVARIGPTQAALWVTSTVCPTGEFPSLATALAC